MPKYWVKNYFAHGRFSKVDQRQKTERKKEREKVRKRERKLVITTAKLRMAHASRLGQLSDGNNHGQLRIANATSGGARKAAWAKKNF